MDIVDRSVQRFESLRRRTLEQYVFDETAVGPPDGWCISTIARLKMNDASVIPRITEIQRSLAPIAELYLYPEASLHISLLGCTQREERPQAIDPERVEVIRDAVLQVVRCSRSVRMRLARINLLGTQFFVEVFTDQIDWSVMRKVLATHLATIGESPVVYPDTEPIHLNVARILTAPDRDLLVDALSGNDLDVGEEVLIGKIELVLTDYVVTPSKLAVLEVFSLGEQ